MHGVAAACLPAGVTPEIAPKAAHLGEVYQSRVTSDRHDLYQLRSEMEWNIVRVLRQVPGVADIVPFRGYLKEVHVEADPARLFALGLTLGDLEQAIAKSNLNVGGGFLRPGDQELTVRGIGYLETPEDIKRILLKSKDGTAVTLGDVSNVAQCFTPRRGTVGVGLEKEGIEGFVWMRRGQNPSRVLDGVHDKVRELNETILPKGMRIEIYYDRSDLVGLTLSTVHKNLLSGFVLVVGVVWLFLRSAVGSVAVAVVIPLSLLVAFFGLYALGLPANLISMGAIDFGILVDGAVVLVENVIHALRQDHPDERRERAIAAAFVLPVLAGLTLTRLGTEFLPELDEGDIQLFVEMPPSIALEKGQDILLEVRRRILAFPEVSKTLSEQGRPEDGTDNEGVNMSETFIRLKPVRDWRAGYDKRRLIDEMRESLTEIPGVRYNFSQPMKDNVEEAVSGVRGKVVLKIFGPDLARMRTTLEQAKEVLKALPGIVDLDLYRDASTPQLQMRFDRQALARAGITMGDAQRTLETPLAGGVLTTLWERERPVPIRLIQIGRASCRERV